MKPTFKSIAIFFLGLIIGLVASITIVEKQFWFWHVARDRAMIRLEIRKINLEREDFDDLRQSIEAFMRGIDNAWGKEGK